MPVLNFVSKIDLIESYGPSEFPLQTYLESDDLGFLKQEEKSSKHPNFYNKHKNLYQSLVTVLENYSKIRRCWFVLLYKCDG